MEVVVIAAVAANGIIGRDGTLPWHLPEDLAHFKETTMGHPVIMGRHAFEDIIDYLGEPLPGRTNIVLSRSNPTVPEDVILVESIEEGIAAARATGSETVFIAGGATVYEQFLERADRMILTELEEAYDGETMFPDWDEDEWEECSRNERNGFAFVEYERCADS